MIRKIHLSNAASRDATVAFTGLRPAAPPRPGLPGKDIRFVRYLATSEAGRHEALQARYGEDYAQALVDADPEVDVDQVGRRIGRTDTVYLSAGGDVLYAPPSVVEILLGPDGAEKERRSPDDREANINDEAIPLRWTGRKLKEARLEPRLLTIHFSFKHLSRSSLRHAPRWVALGARRA